MRGFDPTTSDFARHCGYYNPIYEAVQPSRFEGLDDQDSVVVEHETTEGLEDVYTLLPALFGDDTSSSPSPTDGVSFWSRLTSKFSWAASEDSDILAMGF
ncbi:hypothetical protein V5O48_013246 [Marasmius crinis-equi]|uniref:Uncharacterized protein n=1 Tax=Marasmius crinis-equi TaxID=585013 RepID=A0ABR3F0Y4_9AGAR